MAEPLKWYDENADNSPWIRGFAEVRQRATREGYCYQHVQPITVAIDQYAEKALGNRDYFLSKPYSIGSGRNDHVP
jgi:5-methylcytosine-specific restriction endonuclease McrBC regulatory subunit McrC